jgi:hypothetical protein
MVLDLLQLANSFLKSAQLLQQQKTFQDATKHATLLAQQISFLYDIVSEIVASSQVREQKQISIMRPDAKTEAFTLLNTSKKILQQMQTTKNITEIVKALKAISTDYNSFENQYINQYKSFLIQNNFQDQFKKVDMMDRQIKAAIMNMNNFLIAAPSTNTALTPSTTPKAP